MIKIYLCKVIEVMHFLTPNVSLILYTYFNLIIHEILDLKGINDVISAWLDVFIIPSELIIVIVSQQSKLMKSLSLSTIDLYAGNFFLPINNVLTSIFWIWLSIELNISISLLNIFNFNPYLTSTPYFVLKTAVSIKNPFLDAVLEIHKFPFIDPYISVSFMLSTAFWFVKEEIFFPNDWWIKLWSISMNEYQKCMFSFEIWK